MKITEKLHESEDRLLDTSIYRVLMSPILPYQREDLLYERKVLIEFCTLFNILSAFLCAVREMTSATSNAFFIMMDLIGCLTCPIIARVYWYILRYTYDEVLPPIETKISSSTKSGMAIYIDEYEILRFVTPLKVLITTAILVISSSSATIPSLIGEVIAIFFGILEIAIVVDAFIVSYRDYREKLDKLSKNFPAPNDRYEFDAEDFNANQKSNSKTSDSKGSNSESPKISIVIDLSRSDADNIELFKKALSETRQIVANQKAQ